MEDWVGQLATDVAERLRADQEANGRAARSLTTTVRSPSIHNEGHAVRDHPQPSPNPNPKPYLPPGLGLVAFGWALLV